MRPLRQNDAVGKEKHRASAYGDGSRTRRSDKAVGTLLEVEVAIDRNQRLLIVDDNEDNRYTLKLLLEMEGYQDISYAEDGDKALQLLQSQRFDLVLLDVMMPRVGGIQVLERLKAEGRLGDPPIIMVSALEELESTVRCIELGAVDYLPKPFEPVLLRARIRATLDRKMLQDRLRAHHDRMEAELREARLLQIGMCPRTFPPATAERPVESFGLMKSAREVGGDFFDLLDIPDGRLAIVIGDVAGKGAPAALFMARTKDLIQVTAQRAAEERGKPIEPSEIVERVNDVIASNNPSFTFVTLFLGLLDPLVGALHFCNAGHEDPFHLSSAGDLRPLSGGKGPPIGIRRDQKYVTECQNMNVGDALFVYSDGVTEAESVGGEFYGEARLESVLGNHAGRAARETVEAVIASLDEFAAGTAQADDVTVLAVRRL